MTLGGVQGSLLGAVLALALPQPAGHQPAAAGPDGTPETSRSHVHSYLPFTLRPDPIPGCALAGGSWAVRCGGHGRIRDMFAIAEPSEHVLAIGDGAATFVNGRWLPELGDAGWGLQAIAYDPRVATGWAVGEEDRILRRENDVWRSFRDERRNPDTDLYAVSLRPSSGPGTVEIFEGWAAGEQSGHAAFRKLVIEDDESPNWYDVPHGAEDLPPIRDVFYDVRDNGTRPVGLAVGYWPEWGEVLGLSDDRWQTSATLVGRPMDLSVQELLTAAWTFGASSSGEDALFWQRRPDDGWVERVDLAARGQAFIDAYTTADGNIFVGLSPRGDRDVLHVMNEDAEWSSVANATMPAHSGGGADGNRAVAPLEGRWVLHAFGNDVWRWDIDAANWTLVRSRVDFSEVVARGELAWAFNSTRLVAARDGVYEIGAPNDLVGVEPATSGVYAMTADGTVSRRQGTLLTEVSADIRLSGTLHDLDVRETWVAGRREPRVELFAAGADATGTGTVFRMTDPYLGPEWQDEGMEWQAISRVRLAGVTGALVDLDSAPDGAFWSVAATESVTVPGLAAHIAPDCEIGDAGSETCVTAHPLALAPSAVDVDQTGTAWVAAGHVLYRCTRGGCTLEPDASHEIPFGGRISSVAAADADEVWLSVLVGPEVRARSLVLRRGADGWTIACALPLPINSLSLADQSAGQRTLWAAGDWTTLLRHRYSPGAPTIPCISGL